MTRAEGYGADLEFDGETVTIHAGKVAAKLQHTPTIAFPVAAVESVEYRKANLAVNGMLRFRMLDTSTVALQAWGADQPNTVNPQSLVVHWRRKDQAAFAALHDAIAAQVAPA